MSIAQDETGLPHEASGTDADQHFRELQLKNAIAEVFLTVSGNAIYQKVLSLLLNFFESRYGIFGYIERDGAFVCPSITKDVWQECALMEEDAKAGGLIFHPSTWGGLWGRGLTEKRQFVASGPFSLPHGHVQLQEIIVMPIVYKKALVGEIVLADKPGGYSEQDRAVLERTCNYLAPILNSRLEREWAREDLELAKMQAEQASKAKSQFLANMSHELRTPLHGVLGCMQLLEAENLNQASRELVGIAHQSGNTLLQLLNDILELADSDDRADLACEKTFSIRKELIMLREVFAYQLQEKELCFLLKVAEGIPEQVIGNVHRLRQILLKLLDNAIKFSTNGNITVSVDVLSNVERGVPHPYLSHNPEMVSVLFTITDQGGGLSDENLDQVFGVFVQGEMSLSRQYSGAGVGLSMVKKNVREMGGHLSLDNSGPGLTVYVQLPFGLHQ